jgi:hypothetical protein
MFKQFPLELEPLEEEGDGKLPLGLSVQFSDPSRKYQLVVNNVGKYGLFYYTGSSYNGLDCEKTWSNNLLDSKLWQTPKTKQDAPYALNSCDSLWMRYKIGPYSIGGFGMTNSPCCIKFNGPQYSTLYLKDIRRQETYFNYCNWKKFVMVWTNDIEDGTIRFRDAAEARLPLFHIAKAEGLI